MTDPVTEVVQAARLAQSARGNLYETIRRAHSEGATLRAIAKAADLSHEQIRRIVNR